MHIVKYLMNLDLRWKKFCVLRSRLRVNLSHRRSDAKMMKIFPPIPGELVYGPRQKPVVGIIRRSRHGGINKVEFWSLAHNSTLWLDFEEETDEEYDSDDADPFHRAKGRRIVMAAIHRQLSDRHQAYSAFLDGLREESTADDDVKNTGYKKKLSRGTAVNNLNRGESDGNYVRREAGVPRQQDPPLVATRKEPVRPSPNSVSYQSGALTQQVGALAPTGVNEAMDLAHDHATYDTVREMNGPTLFPSTAARSIAAGAPAILSAIHQRDGQAYRDYHRSVVESNARVAVSHQQATAEEAARQAALASGSLLPYTDMLEECADRREAAEQRRALERPRHRKAVRWRDLPDVRLLEEEGVLKEMGESQLPVLRARSDRLDRELLFETSPEALNRAVRRSSYTARELSATFKDKLKVAELNFRLKEVSENGPEKVEPKISLIRFIPDPDHPYQSADWSTPEVRYPKVNPALLGEAWYSDVRVPLVAAHLFLRMGRVSWASWLAGGFLTCWKKMVYSYDQSRTLLLPGENAVEYSKTDLWMSCSLSSNHARQAATSVFRQYALLGLGGETFRSFLVNSVNFVDQNKFTHTQVRLIHPTLHAYLVTTYLGFAPTQQMADQILRKYSKSWGQYIPPDLFSSTVEVALQNIAVLRFGRTLTLAKDNRPEDA